jgi:hypothetical protein
LQGAWSSFLRLLAGGKSRTANRFTHIGRPIFKTPLT